MFKLISNDINYSKLKLKTEALKYELHTLMFVVPPPPHTCTCAMHSCMRERYFLWCAHFLTTASKYLSSMQFEKVYSSVVWGEAAGYNLKMERCTFQLFLGAGGYNRKRERYTSQFFRWSLQFHGGMV